MIQNCHDILCKVHILEINILAVHGSIDTEKFNDEDSI